jgi:16S rRNA (cytosine967-C5)-methyltransferase
MQAVPWDALEGLADAVVAAVGRVLDGAAAEREIDRLLRSNRSWDAQRRAAAVEAIFGVGLWRRRLAAQAQTSNPRALLFALLRDLAAVPERRAGELAELPSPWPPRNDPPRRIADRWSYPDWIETIFLRELEDEAEALAEAMCAPGPIALRPNALRATRDELARALEAEAVHTRPGRFARDALIVTSERPNLLALRTYRDGWFEVQDEASQLVAQLVLDDLRDEHDVDRVSESHAATVLDLCAGAGGKTLALASTMEGRGRLAAWDPDPERLRRLTQRARRAGASVEITRDVVADAVLVDAPCSELGTLRRGPDLRWRLREDDAVRFPDTQRKILEEALPHVRSGGRLVYATCTLRRQENEDVAIDFEHVHPELRRVEPDLPSELVRGGFLRAWPHRHDMDGFFAAVWRKV